MGDRYIVDVSPASGRWRVHDVLSGRPVLGIYGPHMGAVDGYGADGRALAEALCAAMNSASFPVQPVLVVPESGAE